MTNFISPEPFKSGWLEISDEEFAAVRQKNKDELTRPDAWTSGLKTAENLQEAIDSGAARLMDPVEMAQTSVALCHAYVQRDQAMMYIIDQLWDAMTEMRAAHRRKDR